MYKLLERFIEIVPQFEKVKEEQYAKQLAYDATVEIDRLFVKNNDEKINLWEVTFNTWEKHRKKIDETILRSSRNPSIDFSASCVIIPLKRNKKHTLVLFYEDNAQVRKLWQDQDFISEYYYQNSTDKPDSYTEEEWDLRRDDWDQAIGCDTPRNRGLCFTFTDERPPLPSKETLNHIPSNEKRAENILFDRYVNEKSAELQAKTQKNVTISEVMKIMDNWKDYKITEECQKQIIELTPTLLPIDFGYKNNNDNDGNTDTKDKDQHISK